MLDLMKNMGIAKEVKGLISLVFTSGLPNIYIIYNYALE